MPQFGVEAGEAVLLSIVEWDILLHCVKQDCYLCD